MQGEIRNMRTASFSIAMIVPLVLSTASMAQNCRQYPVGPARFSCLSSKNPTLEPKLQRCKQQAYDMGLRPGVGRSNGPMFKGYVHACMHRPG
jgi:hypothetical protein